jgi:hypothetical protein
MKRFLTSVYLILLPLIVFNSCKDEYGTPSVPENIKTGTVVQAGSSVIGAGGGTLLVSQPGTAVDGLRIGVPAGSYTAAQTFTVSYAPIESHKFGQYFNPVSPMITIACDGGYASQIMEVTVPVNVPEGHIPIGFFLDKSTGKLEGIPFSAITKDSITLTTRHFLSGDRLRTEASALKSGSSVKNSGASIIVSSIAESVLNAQPVIASGFKPGTDDWEFTNYGSYIAPGGHCAGQNIAAMWYYFEKKATEGSLFNKFSDNTALWQDNALGYRFCSVVHADLVWDGKVSSFFNNYIDRNQDLDRLKFLTIAGTMLATGEPQGIGIYLQTGTDAAGSPVYAGHDLICYQVSVSAGKLFISDPNTPAAGQVIEMVNDKFKPYDAKLNGNSVSLVFPFVTYYAKTAYIEWDKIGKRYAEILNQSIGNVEPNIFPPWSIWVKGVEDRELRDGMSIDNNKLRCVVECPTAERYFLVGGKRLIWHDEYDQDGGILSTDEGAGSGSLYLKPGLNTIGFYIHAEKNGELDGNGHQSQLYIDFKWFNVYYSKLRIEPDPIVAEPGKDVTITARTDGTAPKDAKYVWNFGDGSKEETARNDSTVVHKFSQKGDYLVTVKLYDNAKGTLVGQATAPVSVQEGKLVELQACEAIHVTLSADFLSNSVSLSTLGVSLGNRPLIGSTVTGKWPLTWNGTKFSCDYSAIWFTSENEKVTTYCKFDGEVSANGLILKTLTASTRTVRNQDRDVREQSVTVTEVPFTGLCRSGDERCFTMAGSAVSGHVANPVHTYIGVANGESFSYRITGVNYNSTDKPPILEISFNL